MIFLELLVRQAVPAFKRDHQLIKINFQLYDRVPSAVRGVDRVHVGLYLCGGGRLHPLLHGHGVGGELGYSQPVSCPAACQLLRHGRR